MNTENASPEVLQEFMDDLAADAKAKLKEVRDQAATLGVFSLFSLEDMAIKDRDIFTGHNRATHLYKSLIRLVDKIKATSKWKIAETQKLISSLEIHCQSLDGEIEAFIKWSGNKKGLPVSWDSSMRTHLRNKVLIDKILILLKDLHKLLVFHQIARQELKKKADL